MFTRIKITAKDISIITGYNIKYCYRIHQTIRDALGKKKHSHLTIKEFCEYFGYPILEVQNILV